MALATLNNYRTGISLSLAGTNGTDWMLEPLYWDRPVEDRAVIYIRSATLMDLAHNARNRMFVNRNVPQTIGANGLDGVPNSGDEGIIRYRVDGDLAHGSRWSLLSATATNSVFPAWPGPTSFAALNYSEPGSGGGAVLGRLGDNGQPQSSKSTYFHYGLTDAAGNECHTISVADDSRLVPGVRQEVDNFADDGRYLMFVVDPKTPVIQTRATGSGQFYTTPWKTYYIPKIHAQITYFQGTIEMEIKALTGEDVFYRINGGSWVQANNPTLTDADFATGTNTLECYYNGSSAFVATRTVVKNPGFPSSGETHGNLLSGSDANWAAMQQRITREPYKSAWNTRIIRTMGARDTWDAVRRQGTRNFAPSGATAANAIAAKFFGNDYVPTVAGGARTYAAYAKEMLLENTRVLDCIAFEGNHNGDPMATREHIYRGYTDVGPSIDMARAYDILIAQYRSDQHANGITPIEDYYIRDCMASNIVECLMYAGAYPGSGALPNVTDYGAGLWDVSRKCGALIQVLAMPTYSTPYYGTNGLDGNTTTYDLTPFPAGRNVTWKKAFLEDDSTLTGYPGMSSRFGIDRSAASEATNQRFNWRADGVFGDKIDYVGNTFSPFVAAMNACKWHYPQKQFPHAEAGYRLAASGQVYGIYITSAVNPPALGPGRNLHLALINASFPAIADIAKPYVDAAPAGSNWSPSTMMNGTDLLSLAYYDDTYVPGVAPETQAPTFTVQPVGATRTEGEAVTFTVTVTGNPTPTLQWRKDGVNISGQTGTSYTIASTVVGDAGIYDCVATNLVGSVTSAQATLVVNAVPPTPSPVTRRTNYSTPAAAFLGL